MTNFLIWNTYRKSLSDLIVQFVRDLNIDVLLLLENCSVPATLLSSLRTIGNFHVVPSHPRFQLYVRFDISLIKRLTPRIANARSDFWHLSLPAQSDILLVGVHGLDIRNNSSDKREMLFARIVSNIKYIEDHELKHKRTFVVGDFNANPFESVIGSVRGLHAVQMRSFSGKSMRRVDKADHDFFYNPMWSCYGKPPATFFFNNCQPHEHFWHMLDQVVLRPAAIPLFLEDTLAILKESTSHNLLTAHGIPDAENASDHLPLFFSLNLKVRGTNVN